MSIFVFGSNEAGIHGAGAALVARKYHDAVVGKGFGPQGDSFAIPTKDWHIKTLPLDIIKHYVDRFIAYAKQSPETFHLTKIGCGYAGYDQEHIAPLFEDAPANVILIHDDGSIAYPASQWYASIK